MAIGIAQIGIGPLGREMTRAIHNRANMEVVAAVDTDPELHGRDLGELCALGQLGIPVGSKTKSVLASCQADVVLLTTVSDLASILPQIEEILDQGLPVVSTCEELTYPWITALEPAARLDARAKQAGVAVLAEVAEAVSSVWFARKGGASRRAAWYGLVGGLAGAFLLTIPVPIIGTVIGAAIGCFAGAMVGELSLNRDAASGARAGFYAALGRTLGTMFKIAAAVVMSGLVVVSALV